ncbi:hypothetical protein GQ457_04G017110 [Hibiscus cannabinus]
MTTHASPRNNADGMKPPDINPPPSMDALAMYHDSKPAGESLKPMASYKDSVMGGSDSHPDEDLIPIEDDDIELLDEDVHVGVTDGILFIDFPPRVHDLAVKSFEFTLILKILGRCVGYTTFYNRLVSVWKPTRQIKLIEIENVYFLVKFSSRLDYIVALTEGPWTIFGHHITVEPWSPDFIPLNLIRVASWLGLVSQVCQLPGTSEITKPIVVDLHGCFARMAVKISLKQPLISKIVINGRTQIVE